MSRNLENKKNYKDKSTVEANSSIFWVVGTSILSRQILSISDYIKISPGSYIIDYRIKMQIYSL